MIFSSCAFPVSARRKGGKMMKMVRDIIEIDEEKCDGCGLCILSCAEGALVLVDGKAKVLREPLCDGLGACLSACPMDALKIIRRESEAFDEKAVQEHLGSRTCSSPLSMETSETSGSDPMQGLPSGLGNWPVQLRLITPSAPFLKKSDLLLLADCVAVACPGLHRDLLPGKRVVMTCPKLDDAEEAVERLVAIFREAEIRSLSLAIMEVPCCAGLAGIVREAIRRAGLEIPCNETIILRSGKQGEARTSLRPFF